MEKKLINQLGSYIEIIRDYHDLLFMCELERSKIIICNEDIQFNNMQLKDILLVLSSALFKAKYIHQILNNKYNAVSNAITETNETLLSRYGMYSSVIVEGENEKKLTEELVVVKEQLSLIGDNFSINEKLNLLETKYINELKINIIGLSKLGKQTPEQRQ